MNIRTFSDKKKKKTLTPISTNVREVFAKYLGASKSRLCDLCRCHFIDLTHTKYDAIRGNVGTLIFNTEQYYSISILSGATLEDSEIRRVNP
jgi:hypothetical protein